MRGATACALKSKSPAHISIHAPHAGCDMFDYDASQDYSVFQSTHPMRGATLTFDPVTGVGVISIHAPHAGCDRYVHQTALLKLFISIHAPHAGCDSVKLRTLMCPLNFNPRTPCGVRRAQRRRNAARTSISIHAPHAGCDRWR